MITPEDEFADKCADFGWKILWIIVIIVLLARLALFFGS